MSGEPEGLGGRPQSRGRRWRAPYRLALAVAWLIVTGILAAALARGARQSGELEAWSTALQVPYVAALLWHLGRTGPPLAELPAAGPGWVRRSRLGQLLSAVALALLLAMTALSDEGDDLVLLFMMAATLWALVAWRRQIRGRQILVGSALAATAFLAGLPFRGRDLVSDTVLVLLPAFVLPMFVVGGLLIERTGFGASQLHRGRPRASAASFLSGCALFVPLGLVNAADDPPGTSFDWITEG